MEWRSLCCSRTALPLLPEDEGGRKGMSGSSRQKAADKHACVYAILNQGVETAPLDRVIYA